MIYRGEQRYQFQPWYIKAYRHLRHAPASITQTSWAMLKWVVWYRLVIPEDLPCATRWQVFTFSLSCWRGLHDCRVGYYYTSDEVFTRLRAKR